MYTYIYIGKPLAVFNEEGQENTFSHNAASFSCTLVRGGLLLSLQGFLAHTKSPTPPGPPKDPRHRPTVGSWDGALSSE